MRKIVLPFVVFVSSLAFVNAQEAEPEKADYNKWSVELNGGLSKPTKPFAGGYYVGTFEFNSLHGDLGVRYMFNPKFGLKADVGYDKIENGDKSSTFDSSYMRFNLQGVVNLGRVLNFEDWTNTFGLLGHAGIGYGLINGEYLSGDEYTDNVGVFMAGLTGQVKLSDRFVLNADFTAINNMHQDRTWDGATHVGKGRGFEKSFVYNATLGLTVYFGKNQQHADWVGFTAVDDELADLEERIAELEGMLVDSDKDGVPDYLDMEPNSTPGVAVDSKGRVVDTNGNGVPDELEGYLETKYGVNAMKSALAADSKDNNELVKEFINGGYVTTYFDFDKDQPTNVSSHGIDFIRTYLLNNPSASIDIFGHADEVGNADYNYGLANRRAQNVKNILVKAGISENRLNVVSKGEDSSVEPSSTGARKLVRRVTFQIK